MPSITLQCVNDGKGLLLVDPFCQITACAQIDAGGCAYVMYPAVGECSESVKLYIKSTSGSSPYYVITPDCNCCTCDDLYYGGLGPNANCSGLTLCHEGTTQIDHCWPTGASNLLSGSISFTNTSTPENPCHWTGTSGILDATALDDWGIYLQFVVLVTIQAAPQENGDCLFDVTVSLSPRISYDLVSWTWLPSDYTFNAQLLTDVTRAAAIAGLTFSTTETSCPTLFNDAGRKLHGSISVSWT